MNCTEKNVQTSLKNQKSEITIQNFSCVSCHMPKSGSTDIPHVTVHDHYIRKPVSKHDKEKIKIFLGLFAINEKAPDSLTKAKAYISQYEKFEQKGYYLDSAQKYLSEKNKNIILKNFDALVQLNFLKNDFGKVIALVNNFGTDELLKTRLNKKAYDNQHAWTCYRIGESFNYSGKTKEAVPFFEQACKLAPFVPDFMDKLATAYASTGNNKMAHHYFELALKENPKHVSSISNLGFLFLTEGNSQMAEQLYNKALSLDPDNEEALMNLAGLYNFKGNTKEAISILKRLLKRHPQNKKAEEILKTLEKNRLAAK